MHRLSRILAAFLFAIALVGCSSPGATTQSGYATYATGGSGVMVPATRSASDGDTSPGKQEILGLYLPLGPNLEIKAGLNWNQKATVITLPPLATQAAPVCEPQYVEVQRTVMVPETYTETKTRLVPRTVTERRAVVPAPQAAPCAPPQYAPAPQAAPQGCPEPAPEPFQDAQPAPAMPPGPPDVMPMMTSQAPMPGMGGAMPMGGAS